MLDARCATARVIYLTFGQCNLSEVEYFNIMKAGDYKQ